MLGAPKSDCRGGSTDGAARDGRMRLRPFFIERAWDGKFFKEVVKNV